jgi:hypothetical protein
VRMSIIEGQRELYKNRLNLFFNSGNNSISASDVISTFRDYYQSQHSYYDNIAYSEIQKMHIRHLLMDFVTPFDNLGDVSY